MKRKLAVINFLFLLVVLLFTFIYLNFNQIDPLESDFNGIVEDHRRSYPGLIKFSFLNDDESYTMSNNLEEFYKSISNGDSIVKIKNDPYIYIYKKEKNKYVFYKKFIYE